MVTPARQRQVLHRQRVAHRQLGHVRRQGFGNLRHQALNLNAGHRVLDEGAGLLQADRLAGERHLHVDLDALVEVHAGKVQVHELRAQVVPLDLLDQARLLGAIMLHLDHARVLAHQVVELLIVARDVDGVLLVAVDDSRQPAGLAQPRRLMRAELGAAFCFEGRNLLLSHETSLRVNNSRLSVVPAGQRNRADEARIIAVLAPRVVQSKQI